MRTQTWVENYLIIILACALLIIVFLVSMYLLKATSVKQQNKIIPKVITITPTIAVATNKAARVIFDPDAQNRLLLKIETRKTLSQADYQAKAQILTQLPANQQWGQLYETPNISIEYIDSRDIFMVEIRTTAIENAKKEANVWFRVHGFSQDAICNYPVQFYLNSDIMNKLIDNDITFSPLGVGC